jgi:hypothetical protein
LFGRIFIYKFDLEHFKSIFVKERICGFAKVLSPQKLGPHIAKSAYRKQILDLQIANPQIAALAEGLQVYHTSKVRKFADLQYVEIIHGPPASG